MRFIALLLLLCTCAQTQAKPSNVLRHDSSTALVEQTGTQHNSALGALRDGDTTNSARLSGPVEFSLALDELSALESLTVHLSATMDSDAIAEVEVLGSIASANSGFKRLRLASIRGQQRQQRFRFRPTGVRWLVLKITPAEGQAELPISELELLGRPGPPQSAYQFKESPASAIAVLNTLQGTLNVRVSADELALFDDAKDGRLDNWSLADAALIASGVTSASARQPLLHRIDRLAQLAANEMTAADKLQQGEQLLQWLHQAPMKAGYQEDQTRLSTLLNKGVYNCVSSAVLFSVLGKRQGIDVRGIEVPDHALAIVYDGTRNADVETTTPAGFNPSRSRAAVDAFTQRTGFAYIPSSRSDQRREISPLGLVALIYYNRGVEFSRQERYQEALKAYFSSLSLDREAGSAVKNALAGLANWSVHLAKKGEFQQALQVVGAGLKLAPEDRTLLHNRKSIWQEHINRSIAAGDQSATLALIDQAHAAVPDGGFSQQKAYLYIRPAQQLADDGQWLAALARIDEAKLDAESSRELQRFQSNLILRWSSAEISAQRWQPALDALAIGVQRSPEERRYQQNIAYVLQEWSDASYRQQGADQASSIVNSILARFPNMRPVERAARSFAIRRIRELRDGKHFDEALDAIRQYQNLLPREREVDTLVRSVFDRQAQTHYDAGRWQEALAVYADARGRFPDNKQLRQNEIATWHSWAKPFMENGDWASALDVYEQALAGHQQERGFQQNIAYSVQELLAERTLAEPANQALARQLQQRFAAVRKIPQTVAGAFSRQAAEQLKQERFEQALAIAEAARSTVTDQRNASKPLRQVYDSWARYHSERQEWQQAVDVYQQALATLPNDAHLNRNAVATWHAWAKPHLNASGCKQAIAIYQRGLERMPGTALFKQNIRYCEQQLGL